MPTTSASCFPRSLWWNSSSRRGKSVMGRWPRRCRPLAASLPAQLGDYRILRYLGEGGMGVVYEAVRESLRSHVALKVMHPQYRNRPNYLRRFHTEARSAARLHHTNIVSVFDYGEHDGVCYYAMQYIAGQSLDKVLDDIRQLRLEKEGLPTGETVTLPCPTDSPGEHDDLAGEDNAQCATNSLRQTVTLGLLTGRFATAGADENPGEQDDPTSFRGDRRYRRGGAQTWAPRPVASCRSCTRPKPRLRPAHELGSRIGNRR